MSAKSYYVVPNASPPPPSSLYSHAVEAEGWLHVTGQLPSDPEDPAAALREGIEAQSEMCFENINRILSHAGYSLADTVFIRIFLKEFDRDFASFNVVYVRHFPQDRPLPSRTTVGVCALGRGALVEIDLVCFRTRATKGPAVVDTPKALGMIDTRSASAGDPAKPYTDEH